MQEWQPKQPHSKERGTALHKAFSKAELQLFFMLLILFYHPSSKTVATYSMLKAQATWALNLPVPMPAHP